MELCSDCVSAALEGNSDRPAEVGRHINEIMCRILRPVSGKKVQLLRTMLLSEQIGKKTKMRGKTCSFVFR